MLTQQIQFFFITFVQRRSNVGPTLYKCYTNVSCLLEANTKSFHKRADQRYLVNLHCKKGLVYMSIKMSLKTFASM